MICHASISLVRHIVERNDTALSVIAPGLPGFILALCDNLSCCICHACHMQAIGLWPAKTCLQAAELDVLHVSLHD